MSSSIVDRNGGTTSASPTTSRDVGLASSAAVKIPCVAIALTPITLWGEQTIDTVVCVTGDPVAVAGQVDPTANGIYIVSTGAWQRSPDFNRNDDVVDGSIVIVTGGSNQGMWNVVCATSPAIIGTTAIDFEVSVQPGLDAAVALAQAAAVSAAASAALAATFNPALYLTLIAAAATYATALNAALTGNPTAPTPTAGDNDTSIATTAFVVTEGQRVRRMAYDFIHGVV